MIRASSLSGDTLIACHFPVQLPTTTTWQLHPIQVGRCGSLASNNKPGRLCAAGRAVSLPEQGSLHRLEPFTASSGLWRRNVSSSHGSLKEDRVVEEEGAGSDSSGRDDSASSPEEVVSAPPATNVIGAHRARKEGGGGGTRACLRSRNNSFLPCSELDEDEDEDSEGDNLHRYREDSSFVLHGNSNWALVSNNASGHSRTPRAGDMEGVLWWGKEVGTLLEADMRDGGWLSNRTGLPDITFPSCQCFLVRRSRAILTDRGEQEWPRLNETRKSCVDNGLQHRCCVSEMSNGHVAAESVSDSSSNSSDGVLVNFCAIYDKSSDPSVPRDLLGSPAMEPSSPSPVQAADGSVFLNLRPVSQQQTPNADVQQTGDCWTVSAARLEAEVDIMMGASAACQSPRRGLDTNCNLYPVPGPPLSQVLTSSLEVSDLNACLQSQATLATGTNQKYYKLVTCEPPSQSPSPAWSSLFVPSCADGQRRRASPDPLPSQCLSSGQRKDAQQKDKVKEKDEQRIKESPKTSSSSAAARSSTVFDYARCDASKTQFTSPGSIHSYSHTAVSVCSQSNAENILGQGPGSIVAAQPSFVTLDQAHCEDEAEAHGTCPSAAPVVRYTKAQRPTSLPIQPCVLLTPPGQPQQAQQLGSLLDQYMSQRATGKHSSGSQPGCNKGKGSGISTYLQPSPLMGNHGQPFLLEAPSSSDTCSTCASSPECSSHWNTWSEYASTDQGQSSLCGSQISLTYSSSPKPKVGQAPACQDDASARLGATRRDDVLKSLSFKPSQTSTSKAPSAPNQPERLVTVATCRDLVNLVPEEEETPHASTEPKHHTSPTHIRSSSYHAALSQSPSPAASPMSRVPALLVSPCPPVTPQPRRESPRCPSAAQTHLFQDKLAASLSPAILRSPAVAGSSGPQQPQQRQDLSGPGGTTADQRQCQQHRSESLILSDRPPVEFCLSPDASYDSLSLSHLQRRGLLRSVSMAVDLIMAHFGSSRDPEDKMRLGNSSWSPTIAGLVLEHLCPTVQNILEDGLRDHKLDVIIGQRRNHTWSVVEVSTQTGSCARVLNSLVSKINQCSQLADYSIRLRAFIMGLLNLRALEYWLCHLHIQKDVVTTHYHSWGFLAMSQGQSQPLFQELLLLLQPLSMLPFDLNLLLEPRLLHSRQLCSEEYGVPPPCSTLLMTSWPLLQADKKAGASSESSTRTTGSPHRVQRPQASSQKPPRWCQYRPQVEENRAVPDGHRQPARTSPAFTDGVVEEGEDCCRRDSADHPRVPSFRRGEDDETRERGDSEGETVGTPSGAEVRDESPSQGGLRWAKLFGAAMDPASTTTRTNRATSGNVSGTQQPRRRPSEWLQLNRSQLGLLAQSVCSVMELITWTETSRTTQHQSETFPDRR